MQGRSNVEAHRSRGLGHIFTIFKNQIITG